MARYLFAALALARSYALLWAEENGLSYWWHSDGIIDAMQMDELDDLSGDSELWCALAELYAGRDLAEEAGCAFSEPPKPGKGRGGRKAWSVNFKEGANLDSSGGLINKFARASAKAGMFSGEAGIKEGKGAKGFAGFRLGGFSMKGGDLTSKHRGALAELAMSDLKLGGQWLLRDGRDSSLAYGKYSKNLLGRSVYAGGNFRMAAPYRGGNMLWGRSWLGARSGGWNFRATEVAAIKESENALDFIWLAERKREGARLAFEHDKNKDRISAGFKPSAPSADSLWARADYPVSTRIGWDKRLASARISNSFYVKKKWDSGKPLEYRSESKMKMPFALSPLITFRWTAHIYRDGRLSLKQFYMEGSAGF